MGREQFALFTTGERAPLRPRSPWGLRAARRRPECCCTACACARHRGTTNSLRTATGTDGAASRRQPTVRVRGGAKEPPPASCLAGPMLGGRRENDDTRSRCGAPQLSSIGPFARSSRSTCGSWFGASGAAVSEQGSTAGGTRCRCNDTASRWWPFRVIVFVAVLLFFRRSCPWRHTHDSMLGGARGCRTSAPSTHVPRSSNVRSRCWKRC